MKENTCVTYRQTSVKLQIKLERLNRELLACKNSFKKFEGKKLIECDQKLNQPMNVILKKKVIKSGN